MALLGILLVALNLRTAVAVISPIATQIGADIPLDEVGLGVIGSLPPVAFALAGLVGASIARRIGLEHLLVLSIVMMVAGHGIRALAPGYGTLVVGTVVVFAGIGLGNVLLPPLVKRYFPDRIAIITTLYVTMMSVGTAVPALVVTPVADSAGWRASLGLWALFAVIALVPWVAVVVHHRRDRAIDDAREIPSVDSRLVGGTWRSRTSWLLAALFGLSSFHAYASFSLLPGLLVDTAGVSGSDTGLLLALYGLAGLPASIIVPVLVSRMSNVTPLLLVGLGTFVAGYGGLLVAPSAAPALWVVLSGCGLLLFPALLVLINLRSRTTAGSVAVSGFVQGIGYTIGATGPLLIGVLHAATGGWTVPLLVLIATVLACVVPALMIGRHTYIEDEIAR
ncbi:MAG: MFS transporter [Burkholderiaceae bacterium]|nr:MFS transporter [Microbacteriaceae bacterium]